MVNPAQPISASSKSSLDRHRKSRLDARQALEDGDFDRMLELLERQSDADYHEPESVEEALAQRQLLAETDALIDYLQRSQETIRQELVVMGRSSGDGSPWLVNEGQSRSTLKVYA